MAKRVTIKDIAKRLGVTPTTISMVIHNNKSIPEKTRQRVLKAIREMKYYPNKMARSLVYGKTDTIAVIAPFFHPLFFQQLMRGIETRVQATEFHINQYTTFNDPERTKSILRAIIFGRQADGLIFFNISPDTELQQEILENQIPLVILETDLEDFHSVTCNNHLGAYLATEYLLRQGYRDIVLVTGSMAVINSVEVSRVAGYKAALLDGGVPFDVHNVFELTEYGPQAGAACLMNILEHQAKPDAVFCAAGDSAALGIIHAARNRGIRVPEDMGVIGYDDQDFAPYLFPSLSTVRQPGQEMGRKSVEILLECLSANSSQALHKIEFEPQLIIRHSS